MWLKRLSSDAVWLRGSGFRGSTHENVELLLRSELDVEEEDGAPYKKRETRPS